MMPTTTRTHNPKDTDDDDDDAFFFQSVVSSSLTLCLFLLLQNQYSCSFWKKCSPLSRRCASKGAQKKQRQREQRASSSPLSLLWSFFVRRESVVMSSGKFWDKRGETIEKFRQKTRDERDFKRSFWTIYTIVSSLCILCYDDDDSDDSDDDFFLWFGAKSNATGRPVHQLKKTNLVAEIPDV